MSFNQDSPDSFTTVTQTGWFSRLGRSFVGILFGIMFLIAAPCALWWNEGNEVKAIQGLQSAEHSVVTIEANAVNPALNNKLVYLSGTLTASAPPTDPIFGVAPTGYARLQRKVEMYQWNETKTTQNQKELGGGMETITTYNYSKQWSSSRNRSESFQHTFGHQNPQMSISSDAFDAPNLAVGVYSPDQNLLTKLNKFSSIIPEIKTLPPEFHQSTNGLYKGGDENNPQIGDLRVSFSAIPLGVVSIVAQQQGARLFPYQTPSGFNVELLEPGMVSADTLLNDERSSQITQAWIVRGLCFLFIFLGIKLILAPLTLLAAFIPFFEDIADFATGLVSAALSLIIFCVVIFVCWIAFRPLWAGAIAVVGVASCYGLFHLRANIKRSNPPDNKLTV